jgi:serine/threonine protein kinase
MSPLVPDRRVGPYRLLERVGRGSMAEVFKAEHSLLGQIRGLKILLPEIAAQPEQLSRLLTEARTMARLRHPTIAEVYDCDVQGDSAFIVMEFLPGITLRTWCEHVGKLARNPGLAAAITGILADGLAFAHQHGVVHRDLKPENVLLTPVPGQEDAFALKILDFGVAKLLRGRPRTATREGFIVGTPLYMAPEQWSPGTAVDHRTDIYALGCLLFELLCGRTPFCEGDTAAIMRAHLRDPPPDLKALEPDVPSRLRALFGKMVAKSAEDRHASMEQVLTELEAISGRRRTEWNGMLRTPRTGAMSARGTLVISLEQTIVQRVGLLERVLPKVQRLLRRLRAGLGGLALPRLSGWPRWLPTLPSLPRLPGAGTIALVFCSSALVAGTLLWAGRALLASGGASPGSVVSKPAPSTAVPRPDRARPRQGKSLPLQVPPPAPRRQARPARENTRPAFPSATRYRPVDD